jgi:DMSO/TMAO reductase YedYZ molybdopterin-dependent catalytic subunit
MNDVKLPPDHGYPLRVIIPGYVGGRQVKWLSKIWISEKENDSHYHIWDNRVLVRSIKQFSSMSRHANMSPASFCYRERWRVRRNSLPSP